MSFESEARSYMIKLLILPTNHKNINIPFAEHNFGPLRHMLIVIFVMY